MQLSTLAVLLLTPSVALAQGDEQGGEDLPSLEDAQLEDPRPFAQGDMEASLALGIGAGGSGTQYVLGGAFFYYVLPGLAPGVDVTVQSGSEIDTQTWALIPLKWVLYRSHEFAPYLVVEGGRIFIAGGSPDLWIAGAGPGFHLFSGGRVGLKAQLVFYQLFPSDRCEGLADGCSGYLPELGLSIAF